jgi:transposase
MVEREGRMIAGPVPDETKFTLEPISRENVESDTIVSTDGHHAYRDLKTEYEHEFVNHDAGECVRGIHHANTIEGHWLPFKRAVRGNPCAHFSEACLEICRRV